MKHGSRTAKIIAAKSENVEEIVSSILRSEIVVMPYGKKERRIFAIIGLANDSVIKRMRQIKNREQSEGVAISGIPEVVPHVAELDKTPALSEAARRLNISPQEVIERCFKVGGLGLILIAQDWLPQGATMFNKKGERTVLVAGETTNEEYDIFPKVYLTLINKHNQIMVGTSANLSGEGTYHILEQNKAIEKLKNHVDLFVYDELKIGIFPIFKHMTSTTMIDLTDEKAQVVRWGSIYPNRFKKIFPDLSFDPKRVKYYEGRERLHHVVLKRLFGH